MSARLSILAYGLERRQQRRRDGPASVGSCRHMLDVLDGWAVTVGTNEGLLGRGWQVRSGTLPTRRKVVTASCEAGSKPLMRFVSRVRFRRLGCDFAGPVKSQKGVKSHEAPVISQAVRNRT